MTAHVSGYRIPPDETRFPPLIEPVRLRERQDAFKEAVRAARDSGDMRAGAGTFFYVGRFELIEFAIVLEPQEPLKYARKIFLAGMNALADALAVLSPPEKDINFRFPGSLYFDGALVGGGRLAAPEGCGDNEAPEWLVFGAMIRAGGMRDMGAGMSPEITTLDDEGFEAWEPAGFSASFARHFLVEVDSWHERGVSTIAPRYLSRLEKAKGQGRRGIDENGDLLIHEVEGRPARRVSFVETLAKAEWFDPLLNEPRA